MAETKISSLVDKVVEDLKNNESYRFSKSDFQVPVFADLQDPN